MLIEGEDGVTLKLGGQPLQEQSPFPGRRTGDRTRLEIAFVPSHLQPTLYRGQRDTEDPGDLPAIHAAVYRFQHLEPEILRAIAVGFL
jgi:hypothetical protein